MLQLEIPERWIGPPTGTEVVMIVIGATGGRGPGPSIETDGETETDGEVALAVRTEAVDGTGETSPAIAAAPGLGVPRGTTDEGLPRLPRGREAMKMTVENRPPLSPETEL